MRVPPLAPSRSKKDATSGIAQLAFAHGAGVQPRRGSEDKMPLTWGLGFRVQGLGFSFLSMSWGVCVYISLEVHTRPPEYELGCVCVCVYVHTYICMYICILTTLHPKPYTLRGPPCAVTSGPWRPSKWSCHDVLAISYVIFWDVPPSYSESFIGIIAPPIFIPLKDC